MRIYRTGWKQSHPDHPFLARQRVGFSGAAPTDFSAESFEGSILDQNSTSSCTGHGTSQAIQVAMAMRGTPLSFRPSPRGLYGLARAMELAAETPPDATLPNLVDDGASSEDALEAAIRWGVARMKAPSPMGFNTDIDSSNSTLRPSLEDLEESLKNLLIGGTRLDPGASDFDAQLTAGVASCGSATIGIFVDKAFMNWNPSQGPIRSVDRNDPDGGWHNLCLDVYRQSSGELIYRGPNSWGLSYGDSGHYEITSSGLQSAIADGGGAIVFTVEELP